MDRIPALNGPISGIPGAVARQVEDLPGDLADGIRVGPFAQAKPGTLLLVVPGVARYLIRDGRSIDIAVEPDADPGAVMLYFRGSARGTLTLQRGELPLHAATLVPPHGKEAVAICGVSGAGKSTLAAELVRCGWSLVADDMTRVTSEKSEILAWPGDGVIKLWRDACDRSGLDTSSLLRVREDVEKFFWNAKPVAEPFPLRTIVELNHDGALTSVETSGADGMALLSQNTFRRPHIVALGVVQDHMRMVAQVAKSCRIVRLKGARSVSLAALAGYVADLAGA